MGGTSIDRFEATERICRSIVIVQNGELTWLSVRRYFFEMQLVRRSGHRLRSVEMNDFTRILNALAKGVPGAANELFTLVYDELRRRAAMRLAQEAPGYRLRKFVRRNRGAVVAALAIVVVLVAGIVGTTLGLIEARWSEKRADGEAENSKKLEKIAKESDDATKIALGEKESALNQSNAARKDLEYAFALGKILLAQVAFENGRSLELCRSRGAQTQIDEGQLSVGTVGRVERTRSPSQRS